MTRASEEAMELGLVLFVVTIIILVISSADHDRFGGGVGGCESQRTEGPSK